MTHAHHEHREHRRHRTRAILRGTLTAVTAGLALTWCIWSYPARVGASAGVEGVPIDGLPPGATDIRWYLPGAFRPTTVYEFTTSEAGFREWVHGHEGPAVEGPEHGEFSVLIYDPALETFRRRRIRRAIIYTSSWMDDGVYLVYDRDTRRAYYHEHSTR